EHVLQLEGGLQTQTVPDDDVARLRFAKRLGYDSDVAFAIELVKHTSAVSRLFATLGGDDDERADTGPIVRRALTEEAEGAELARMARVVAARSPRASDATACGAGARDLAAGGLRWRWAWG